MTDQKEKTSTGRLRLFLASDIHFEFQQDDNWLPPMPAPDEFDVLVLAGDIGNGICLGEGLRRLRKKFPNTPIVYVAGNHEHYGKNIHRDNLAGVDLSDFYFLENRRVDLMGYHFLGATLWTGFDGMGEEVSTHAMTLAGRSVADFGCIRTEKLSEGHGKPQLITTEYMAGLYQQSRAWLLAELQQLDPARTIVTTHFPPAREFRHQYITESLLSAYFQANCRDLIEQYQPAAWLYGHNHFSDARLCGDTQVISNQYGYPGEPTGYRGDLIIQV